MLSNPCKKANHESMEIQYVCIFPNCYIGRSLCYKCLKNRIHNHGQLSNSHILDKKSFYVVLNNLKQIQEPFMNHNENTNIELLIQQLLEIQDNLQNMIWAQNNNQKFQEELIQMEKSGFHQLNEQLLDDILNIYHKQQDDVSNFQKKFFYIQLDLIIQKAQKIKDYISIILEQSKYETDLKYQIIELEQSKEYIVTGAISNDLKYIISGGFNKLLKVWDYDRYQLTNQIQFDQSVCSSKFTDNSKLLYIGDYSGYLYQFNVKNQFQLQNKTQIHTSVILNIVCVDFFQVITSSADLKIIKYDLKQGQKLFEIQAHEQQISGLDYHKNQEIIASGSYDNSIKLFSNNGQIIMEKQNPHNNYQFIQQVLFLQINHKLISLSVGSAIIWQVDYDQKQLEQLKMIKQNCANMSLVLDEQYIVLIDDLKIKVFTQEGQYATCIDHNVDKFFVYNIVQLSSMQAILIKGKNKLFVCKMEFI